MLVLLPSNRRKIRPSPKSREELKRSLKSSETRQRQRRLDQIEFNAAPTYLVKKNAEKWDKAHMWLDERTACGLEKPKLEMWKHDLVDDPGICSVCKVCASYLDVGHKTRHYRHAAQSVIALPMPDTRLGPYVYFIQANRGPIKIGTSRDPKKRMNALRTSSPFDLTLIGLRFGGTTEEAQCHAQFSFAHIRGEWYEPHDSLMEFIHKENAIFAKLYARCFESEAP